MSSYSCTRVKYLYGRRVIQALFNDGAQSPCHWRAKHTRCQTLPLLVLVHLFDEYESIIFTPTTAISVSVFLSLQPMNDPGKHIVLPFPSD